MTRRAWLPYPATTPPPRPDCPDGPRYPNQATAQAALRNHPFYSPLTPTPCTHGHTGWHLTQPETEPEPAGCDPNWRDTPDEYDRLCESGAREFHGHTGIHYRDITTVTAPKEYL